MLAPRVLSRVLYSSAPSCCSSLLSISHLRAANKATAAAASRASFPWSSSLSSSLSSSSASSSLVLRRCFSSGTPADALNGDQKSEYDELSADEVKALLEAVNSGVEQPPDRLSAEDYAADLEDLETVKPELAELQRAADFLDPNRDDPTVNNAILELHSEAFESNWTNETRSEVAEYLMQEWEKGGDAALVIAINKLLENRVTIRGIIDSVGGWYPVLGLAAVIAVSKELVIVNEELLLVTNFLTVFGGLYFQLSDTVLDGYKSAKDAEAKKYYDQRQLDIDTSKALLAAYEQNPKVVELLEQLKTDVNQLIMERSRAKFIKNKADIQRNFLKALDTIVTTEAQAEGKIRRQILERFSDYMHFMLTLKRVRNDGFFQDGLLTAVTELLTGKPFKSEATPVGRLVKAYITNALWTVDWKNLQMGRNGLRFLGIEDDVKMVKMVAALKKFQIADWEKFLKENPKGTQEDYFKARGVKGPETLGAFIKSEIKKDPAKVKAHIEKVKQEQAAWQASINRVIAEEKSARAKSTVTTKTEHKQEKKSTFDKQKLQDAFTQMREQIAAVKAKATAGN